MTKIHSKLTEDMPSIKATKIGQVKNMVTKNPLLVAGSLLILLLIGFGGWQYQQNQELKNQVGQLTGDNGASEKEVKELVETVGKLVVLPENEQPTVATVTDPSKLEGQAFFTSAQTGDKVLIYATAKKAILYRPAQNKIIEVAPVKLDDVDGSEPQVAGSITEVTDKALVPINVQNASGKDGLAQRIAGRLKVLGFQSVTISDAPGGVSGTTSMNYGEQFKTIAPEINTVLNDQATTEIQIGAPDVTLILGSDFIE